MIESSLSEGDRFSVCKNEPGFQRTGCTRANDCFIQQRIGEYITGGVASTLMARDYKSAKDLVVENEPKRQRKYIVRRLTPTECARLQGFPDWWTDGVEGSDSSRYKLWGNGIALPCATDVLSRLVKEHHRWLDELLEGSG